MADFIFNSNQGIVGQGTTSFYALGGSLGPFPTESQAQFKVHRTGTLKNLLVTVTANNGTTTLRSRKNAANGGMSVSITTTGTFEDTTNSDSLAVNDLVNLSIVVGGSHNNSCTPDLVSVLYTDATGGLYHSNFGSASGAVTTFYNLMGNFANTTETSAQLTLRVAQTLSNLRGISSGNGVSAGATTLTVRKNAADGNLALSWPASTTGAQEDTTHSDTFSIGDEVNLKLVLPGTGTFSLATTQVDSDTACKCLATPNAGAGSSSATTWFGSIGDSALQSTEAPAQLKTRVATTLNNLFSNISANGAGTLSVTARVSGSSTGCPSVSYGSGASGILEDTSTQKSVSSTDTINFQIVAAASFTWKCFSVQQEVITPTNIFPDMWHPLPNQPYPHRTEIVAH